VSRRAAIDVGTNSVRLLVAEIPDPLRPTASPPFHPLARESVITRLGDGLDVGGLLRPDAAARTADAVAAYAARATSLGVERPVIVGTFALRAARNPEELCRRLAFPVRVLTAEEEARLGFRGALAGLGLHAARFRTLVIDIGGGSVEVTVGTPREVRESHSLPLGSVVLTRRFLTGDPPTESEVGALREHATRLLDPILTPLRAQRVRTIGVGGTITTMAALSLRLSPYDPDRVHGFRLSRTRIAALTADLRARPLADRRRLPGLQPARADIITAGALVLERVMVASGSGSLVVSEADLLWAILLEA
jgi:exopolyphosphatase / guanosine-5'-triphosphate,3'-diphosphate pyrophosphatase